MSVAAHKCVAQVTNMTFLPALEATTGIPTGISTDFTKPFISQLKINGEPHVQPTLCLEPYQCMTDSMVWRLGLLRSPAHQRMPSGIRLTLETISCVRRCLCVAQTRAEPEELRPWSDRLWCGSQVADRCQALAPATRTSSLPSHP